MKRLLLFISTLLCANVLMAQTTFWIGDIQYEITSTSPAEVEVNDANAGITIANIPETVSYDGTNYSVTSIGEGAFMDCNYLTSVTIGNSVTSIGDMAFDECRRLTSVTIPNSVTSIGGYAFYRCSSLTSIDIPNSVTSIGYYAFSYCSSLTSVILPNNANISSFDFENTGGINVGGIYYGGKGTVNIGNYTFNNVGFIKFYLNGNATTITPSEVSVIGCDKSLSGDIVIPSTVSYEGTTYSVTSIVNSAFRNCTYLTSVTIPNSVTSIGDHAFYNCWRLTSITIPNSVTSIGGGAFDNCGSLTSIDIPNSVTSSIGMYTFYSCNSLTSVTIGNSVTAIGYGAFQYCSSLTSVTIGNSVTSIGNSAFDGCSSLTSVTCLKETAPSLGESVFSSTPSTKTLTIPFGSDYSSWQSATNWSKTNYLIQEGETKELSNDFTINSTTGLINEGVLRIKQGGQLINTTSENVSGVYEIETPTLPTDKWSFVGAPFNGYKLEVIKEGTNDVSVSLFDYGTGTWSSGWATVEDQVGAGEGYFLWSFAAEPTIFTTDSETQDDHYTLNNDVVTVEKNLTTHQEGGNWMALANPYTFKLDIQKFLSAQTGVQGGVYYRLTYNASNQPVWETAYSGELNLTEGFFVNFANPGDNTATFNKDQRFTGSKKIAEERNFIHLTMTEGANKSELLFAQNEEAKQEYDIFDANKMFSPAEVSEPYFVTEGNALVKEEVQSLPYTATLNVKSYESKEITFRIDNIPTDINVYLLDNGQDIKMNGGVEYTTNITAGENADRFQILFKKQQKIERAKTNQITIKNYNRHITIQSQITNLNIEVYNSIGQKVLETKSYDFHLDQVPAGSYVVKAYYGRVSQSQKIVIE